MFFVAGIGIAVFIELLLVSKGHKSAADQILTLWMFLILLHLFLMYLYTTGDIYSVPFLLGVDQPFPLLQGVFLFIYVSSLTNQLPVNKKMLLLHFVPAALVYVYLIPFFFFPAEQKIQVYRNHGAGYEVFNTVRHIAILCSGVFYVIWSALLLRKHRKRIRDQFSDLDKVNLQWLRILTIGLGCIWLLVIIFGNDTLTLGGGVVFVFLIGFFGVRQAEIFRPVSVPSDNTNTADQRPKYLKSGLTEESSGELHRALLQMMTQAAPYKKSELSINDLASQLGVHPNYLSQVINEREKKNFYDFVNTYRIEEFKRLIAMPKNQNFTLLSLAYDCGFSSKSSFNRYFKKATGQTPSEYFAALTASQVASTP